MGRAVIPAMMAAAQLLAAPFAAAQPGLAPAAPPPGLTQAPADPQTGCSAALLPGIQLYPALAPLKEDANARVDLVVGPDGRVVSARIGDGSGDAALDAAALAHVKQAWRWQPYSCPAAASAVTMGSATVRFPYMVPGPPPR